jgi:hypothetical protein
MTDPGKTPPVLPQSKYLKLLRNHIDLETVPFSDRGSRLLICKQATQHQLTVKLAERLTQAEAGIDHQPPLVDGIWLIDQHGSLLDFELTTYPHALIMNSKIGRFICAFHNEEALAVAIPKGKIAGIRLRMRAEKGQINQSGGQIHGLRMLACLK